ncbi:hypothetical protein RI578_14530 [Streptomyces sp. BB1-1-1]|uniref:hypothetical protein n=1 Tax=Streptomyces sp. BB1-1-1 TaxID=3074430 RepID=UPI002877B203|nr:hypothetical protein [Streptomyces sp. BB1-1-1]WND35435.1 hypothetical protein RI578_14530 [Streptomyces sp. BB1-1-1]
MNRRPTLLAALTLTAAAALTLSACGSDDSPSSDEDKIAGADTGGEPSASPSSPAPSTAGDGRPEINLPSDLKLVFEETETGDPVKDAVLADNAERMRAVDAAIAGTDPKGEALGFYNTGKALEAAVSWVAQFEKANATLTGEARYFERRVTLKGKTSAVLTFCADESKGFSKDKKTGEIAKTPVTKNSYVLYNTRLDKNADGVWQTSQIISTRGAAQCQP